MYIGRTEHEWENDMGKAKAVSIIGGADGPTSIFIAGKTGKQPLKERIRRYCYRRKRKRVERKIKPDAHTVQETITYIVEKYHAVEMSKQRMSYIEQRKCLKENLIMKNKPELLGDMREISVPEEYNESTIKEMQRQIQLRSDMIAAMPDDVVPMDLHIYEIHRNEGQGYMEIAVDSIWGMLGASYSGSKKTMKQFRKIEKDICLYYGVTEEDVRDKSERYSSLVTMLSI